VGASGNLQNDTRHNGIQHNGIRQNKMLLPMDRSDGHSILFTAFLYFNLLNVVLQNVFLLNVYN
jgi:hypothetical protein